ncbi:AAEL001990-PA [Aedes aegypti]|uniref:AAEL001990-PA n=1 Tax=Aedes aegypti TaxID=7159 RepID=Q17JL5_AEDAE|nr:AAEL001990-PA [Aedes aegypti]
MSTANISGFSQTRYVKHPSAHRGSSIHAPAHQSLDDWDSSHGTSPTTRTFPSLSLTFNQKKSKIKFIKNLVMLFQRNLLRNEFENPNL